jgi:hypothetical protein
VESEQFGTFGAHKLAHGASSETGDIGPDSPVPRADIEPRTPTPAARRLALAAEAKVAAKALLQAQRASDKLTREIAIEASRHKASEAAAADLRKRAGERATARRKLSIANEAHLLALTPHAGEEERALVREILQQFNDKFHRPNASRYNGLAGDRTAMAARSVAAIPEFDPINVQIGPFYTSSSLTAWLGTSRQYMHELVRQKRILVLTTADNFKVYPAFQFTDKGAPLPYMAEFICILSRALEPWTQAIWFQTQTDMLDGKTPDAWLRAGRPWETALSAAVGYVEVLTGEQLAMSV